MRFKTGGLTRMAGLGSLALLAFASCRREGPRFHDLIAVESVIRELPECSEDRVPVVELDTAVRYPMESNLGKQVSFRGRLERSGWMCHMMACPSTDWLGRAYAPCCNHCGAHWMVGGKQWRGHQPVNQVFLQLAGRDKPMTSGAMDCSTQAIETLCPRPEVIASGTLQISRAEEEGYVLEEARLCIVHEWWRI